MEDFRPHSKVSRHGSLKRCETRSGLTTSVCWQRISAETRDVTRRRSAPGPIRLPRVTHPHDLDSGAPRLDEQPGGGTCGRHPGLIQNEHGLRWEGTATCKLQKESVHRLDL